MTATYRYTLIPKSVGTPETCRIVEAVILRDDGKSITEVAVVKTGAREIVISRARTISVSLERTERDADYMRTVNIPGLTVGPLGGEGEGA